jgi:hypothetical protein
LAGKKISRQFFYSKVLSFIMPDLTELLTYYVIVSVVFIGAPGVFFFIVFMPALQNTKGRMVGYKDHKLYGDSSIYENTRNDRQEYSLQVSGDHS